MIVPGIIPRSGFTKPLTLGADGSSGQVLSTDGAGNLSFGSAASGPSWITAPPGWDTGLKAAVANVASSPMSVLCFGDSMTVGTGSNVGNTFTQPYFMLLRNYLVGKYGLYADSWMSADDAWINAGAANYYTFTGAWGTGSDYGGHANTYPTSTAAYFSITPPYNCQAFDMIYRGYTGGSTFHWSIDGGSATTITVATTNYLYRLAITGLSNASHTLLINSYSVNTPFELQAITSYPNGKTGGGVHFFEVARTGATISALKTRGSDWAGPINSSTPTGFGFPYFADVAIINFSVNDLFGPGGSYSDPAIWNYAAQQIIKGLRRGNPHCSIVFIVPSFPDSFSDVGNWSSVGNKSQSYYLWINEIYKVASQFCAAVVNIGAKWGNTQLAQGFLQSANIHPTIAGHADIASTLEALF